MSGGNGNGRVHTGETRERGEGGRFAPGNTIAKSGGRPRDDYLRDLRERVRKCITPAQLEALLLSMYGLATDDELPAKERVPPAKLVMEYTVGRPDAMDAALQVTSQDGGLLVKIIPMEGIVDDG